MNSEYEIKVVNGQLTMNEQALEVLRQARSMDLEMKRLKIQLDVIKDAMLDAMEKNNCKKYENDSVRITYKAPAVRKVIDTNALKEQGLYEAFCKDSPTKASIVMAFKE